jgi:hypothetical protein
MQACYCIIINVSASAQVVLINILTNVLIVVKDVYHVLKLPVHNVFQAIQFTKTNAILNAIMLVIDLPQLMVHVFNAQWDAIFVMLLLNVQFVWQITH